MIYLGTTGSDGSAIYLDIHAAERQGRGVRICGTIGDGCYEGEVLVEIGRCDCVTFADAWLGGSGFSEFLGRSSSDLLEQALLDAVREMPIFEPRIPQPHGNSMTFSGDCVAESTPFWKRGF